MLNINNSVITVIYNIQKYSFKNTSLIIKFNPCKNKIFKGIYYIRWLASIGWISFVKIVKELCLPVRAGGSIKMQNIFDNHICKFEFRCTEHKITETLFSCCERISNEITKNGKNQVCNILISKLILRQPIPSESIRCAANNASCHFGVGVFRRDLLASR